MAYFQFSGSNALARDFDPVFRDDIRRLGGVADWYIVSQQDQAWMFTPSGFVFAPMTFYDKYGNFYLIDKDGNVSLLLEFDKEISEIGSAEGNRYSTFAGPSVRAIEESQLAISSSLAEQEDLQTLGDDEILATQQELETKAADAKRTSTRRTLSIVTAVALSAFAGFFIFKKLRKK